MVCQCLSRQEMLYRRLGKLQTLLSCTATLDKAKPEKKAAVSAILPSCIPRVECGVLYLQSIRVQQWSAPRSVGDWGQPEWLYSNSIGKDQMPPPYAPY